MVREGAQLLVPERGNERERQPDARRGQDRAKALAAWRRAREQECQLDRLSAQALLDRDERPSARAGAGARSPGHRTQRSVPPP
jgi:hypothetical protein